MNKLLQLQIKEDKKKKDCKGGIFFRGYSNFYKDSNDNLVKRQELRLLKRKSCKGNCCDWIYDLLDEDVSLGNTPIMPEIENGKLYSIRLTNETFDYETGHCDGFDVEIFEVKEK